MSTDIFEDGEQGGGNIGESLILVIPGGDGSGVGGEGFEFGEGGAFPEDGAEEDGEDAGGTGLVALHGLVHLAAIGVFGVEVVGADEQGDDGGGVELVRALLHPFEAGGDVVVVPVGDEALPLERLQVLLELYEQGLVFLGVGEEKCSVCHVLFPHDTMWTPAVLVYASFAL